MRLECTGCGAVQSSAYSPLCGRCGSLTNPVYDLAKTRLRKSGNPYIRFSDLLPLRDVSLLPGEASYTPVVHARNLGRRLKLPNLFLKNETVLPTGTTKYRMAAVSLPYLRENGVEHFCTSSTGNSSTAYAHLIDNVPDLRMTLFTASDFCHRINYRDHPRVNHFVLDGASFVEAFAAAGRYAAEHGLTSERGFFNPGRREGLKLAFMEAAEQVPGSIDCYVQAVSSAMGVYGTFGGARELLALGRIDRLPRLICVQQGSCAPMANAWAEGAKQIAKRHIVARPKGIAHAILRGDPTRAYPYVRSVVEESRGHITSVSEDEIRRARDLLQEDEGVSACFSASAAVAGLMRSVARRLVSGDQTVLVNLTGRDRSGWPIADATWFRRVDGLWRSDEPSSAALACEA